jgi:hypothetical protein
MDQLEIGSSAGLLSRWEHFAYDTGSSRCGAPGSPLQFGPEWWSQGEPDLSSDPTVARHRACDIAPIDVSTELGRATMLSFIWPDQLPRIERLRAALSIAEAHPLTVDRADAGDWLTHQLRGGPADGAATVLFHSIVWQYLPSPTQDAVRAALSGAGAHAGRANPLCWLRMEPATATRAELRLTTWPGATEETLAQVGYHGAGIHWLV